MKRVTFFGRLVLLIAAANPRLAHGQEEHTDTQFQYVGGRIEILSGPVTESNFPISGIARQFTTLPGFASETDVGLGINPGDQIVYNVLSELLFWDGVTMGPASGGTQVRIRNNPPTVPDTVVTGQSEPQPGRFSPPINRIGAATENGDVHVDLQWFLEPNVAPQPAPPPNLGVYGIKLSLATDAPEINDSGPFFYVFNFGLDDATFEEGVQAFSATLAPPLQPGDADQNLAFDQLDLIQVQQSAKYLMGITATWGEGDWDGAPGGSPGNPPAGNGRFDQLDIIAALGADIYLKGPYGAVRPGSNRGDSQTSVGYNANTGELFVDAPAGTELTSINIDSAGGIFTGAAAQNLGGSFDNDADGNIFKATFGSSFGSVSFGNVARAGLSEDFVLADLSVVGSLAGGGALGDVDLVYIPVPEPTTVLLTLVALLTLGGRFFSRRLARR